MDHKQSATPFGRRTRPLRPDWNNCSIGEPPQKALFKKRLPFALNARAGGFPGATYRDHASSKLREPGSCSPVRGENSRSLVPVRIGLSNFVSSCCRYRPGLMLLRLQPADNDIWQAFSGAGDPLCRNLRGAHASRRSVNRVPVPRTRSH